MAANAYSTTSKEATKKTLVKAIENNQVNKWPGLTVETVRNHLPDLVPATDKGHMKQQRKGIRLTTKIPTTRTKKERIKIH